MNLEDKKFHQLEWTRRMDGAMRIAIDGREILAATDMGFQADFDGLRMVNRGGDYVLGRIAIHGTGSIPNRLASTFIPTVLDSDPL